MHKTVGRPRFLAAVFVLLVLTALILGVVARPERDAGAAAPTDDALFAQTSSTPGTLLISEYADARSTIWAVNADDPLQRSLVFQADHALGWDVEGIVSPDGQSLAYLALPPGEHDARGQAALYVFTTGVLEPWQIATQLDLQGGLTWHADGSAVFVRRTEADRDGRERFTLLEIDTSNGQERTLLSRNDVLGLYALGTTLEGAAFAVAVTPQGSDLIALSSDAPIQQISSTVTRDWRISPDGTQLAFVEQDGLQLQVRVISLREEEALRAVGAKLERSGLARAAEEGATGTAAPAWHPDGSLSLSSYGAAEPTPTLRVQADGQTSIAAAPEQGFALPVAWSPDGSHLAVRAFSGTGPGAAGTEQVAVASVDDGTPTPVPGAFVRVLGWWHGAP